MPDSTKKHFGDAEGKTTTRAASKRSGKAKSMFFDDEVQDLLIDIQNSLDKKYSEKAIVEQAIRELAERVKADSGGKFFKPKAKLYPNKE